MLNLIWVNVEMIKGGYFIIDGKEKVVIPQEKFADNMIYIKDKVNDIFSHSAEIRSVSEDASKPMRTTAVRLVAPSSVYSNNQIVVLVPNVKKGNTFIYSYEGIRCIIR